MTIARVTSKGQVTIPSDIRADLEIRSGDRLLFEKTDEDQVTVRVLRRRSAAELAGSLPATRPTRGKEEVREIVRKEVAERVAREGL